MNRALVDTSGILALLVPTDSNHPHAVRAFERLRAREATLVTTSYALLEMYSLLQRRMGIGAVREFREKFAPLLDVIWVDARLHEAGLDLMLARRQRRLSLTDAVSLVVAHEERIDEMFAFDPHLESA